MEYRNLIIESADFQKDSLNSLSPYIGRLRPECAQLLIEQYATPGIIVFPPILCKESVNGHSDPIDGFVVCFAYLSSTPRLLGKSSNGWQRTNSTGSIVNPRMVLM